MMEINTQRATPDRSLWAPGPLDLGADEGARLLALATELVVRHAQVIDRVPVAPANPALVTETVRDWLVDYDFDTAQDADRVLRDVVTMLVRWSVHPTHPRYFGLFNPTPTWPGVAGDLLAAGLNPQLAAYSHAPAAVEIERHVLRILAEWLGLPDTSAGSFTTGGAEANLTAVVIALTRRFASYPDAGIASVPGPPVLYASRESHLAWLKIAHLTGLGRDAVRLVPVDASYRLDVSRLRLMHAADRAAGRLPFLLVGTAGTTGSGALDPLAELAGVARDAGMHFHVDAAWAGAVALSDRLRPLLAGIEQADSVTVDAHKWLSAPMGAGMFLTRHPSALTSSFRVSTGYMPVDNEDASDPYTTSVQWSRRFAGLKAFLALAVAGRPAYAAQLERDVALGELLARRLAEGGWLRVNDTPLPLVCVVDPAVDALGPVASQQWHRAVVDHVVRGGRAWISLVLLDGRAAIRMCLTSHRTTADDIAAVVDALGEARRAVPATAGCSPQAR
ncbi:pyridoxal phosphate-dependent decarboxylase family protein [Micromonospora sp. RTP1Z1]|uniref:pyridoxal phosphate-dependent decarboxylase family protein n=1 Tax=Micromonospora sp. RTP1Z1 TaxID=2994043 RepID=UPI0029C8290A|nr:pyridoxal-dependent decarboxylase [Micromonospora sp. RTP1Z1]